MASNATDKRYQIFDTLDELRAKNAAIDALLGYPDAKGRISMYRFYDRVQHPVSKKWAGIVSNQLIDACKNVAESEIINYYDEPNLKTQEWMKADGWFPLPIMET